MNYEKVTSDLIESLTRRGHQAEAQIVRLDDMLLRMGNLLADTLKAFADLQIDSSSKLQVGAVALKAASQMTVLFAEMKQEGIRTQGLLNLTQVN